MCAVSIGLMGPSNLFGLPDKIYIVMIGMCVIGMNMAFAFIPPIPEILDIVTVHYKVIEGVDPELDGLINDSVATLFNLFLSVSGLIGPIIGGGLYDLVGYKRTMDINMFLYFAFFLIYFFGNSGFTLFSDFKQMRVEMEELKKVKEEIDELKSQKKERASVFKDSVMKQARRLSEERN